MAIYSAISPGHAVDDAPFSGVVDAHTALDHLNFKEDEASHEREGSSSLKFR
jgi:hypothetical protein